MTEKDRLELAERHLTLISGFFPRIDSKVSALFAVAAAELAVLCLNITKVSLVTWWSAVPLAMTVAGLAVVIVNLYRSAYPHLDGGHSSLFYFKEIAKRTEANFSSEWLSSDRDKLTADLLGQVWQNSKIVAKKYDHLKSATVFMALSLIPFAAFLAASSFQTSKVFSIPG
ncbi:Pycsar system effector family protein [Novosphingobium sp. 9U]|uniref:Pycsar system effector family protein n=1 Tax=Novosphingobium sp. 9U TaxID=2653158 RepID=UPI0012F0BF08|nr:Pycsar system effector family protein [Novosphingobium sp. 9U]VWX51774.1 conserved membrane hypothetical protein [Novosphingobium sp. 9U]